jgi:hypothetical protein
MEPDVIDGEGQGGERGLSGRVFVAVAVVVVLVVWGSLFLAFRQWKARYRERAELGAAVVARAIDPLAAIVPTGENPQEWRAAVAETHAMLDTVTASNLLDRPGLAILGQQIAARVAAARPETARATLRQVWDEMEHQAGPVVTAHHTRPKSLRPQ